MYYFSSDMLLALLSCEYYLCNDNDVLEIKLIFFKYLHNVDNG